MDRLLIAEDEPELARGLIAILERNHYAVDAVDNGRDALEYALSEHYDGLILDIMMPGLDGVSVLRELRRREITTPTLFLTAKSDISDRVLGLDTGADDYLAKPFAVSELLARIRSMLRRKGDYRGDVLSFRELSLDCTTYELSYGEKTVRLSRREYQLMVLLLKNPGHIITTNQIMEQIWGWDADMDVSSIWVYTSNLRKRLAALETPLSIVANRGVGYALE